MSYPQLCPGTTPAWQDSDYLLQDLRADYWTLLEYYLPQATNCSCSAASAAMALNALRQRVLPGEPLLNEEDVIIAVNDPLWTARTAENGGGVTMAHLEEILRVSLDCFELGGTVERLSPDPADATTLDSLRKALIRNEASPDSIMLAYFNQATVTGDPDGGLHVSPIGAYNAEDDRVLLMDVDRECWLPYWTSTETLFSALAAPDRREEGRLARETGGCLLISLA